MVPALGPSACKKALSTQPPPSGLELLACCKDAMWGEPSKTPPRRPEPESGRPPDNPEGAMERFMRSEPGTTTEASHGKNASPFPRTAAFRDTEGCAGHT